MEKSTAASEKSTAAAEQTNPAPEYTEDGFLYRSSSVDVLRLVLMLGVCINYFGFPTGYGEFLQLSFGFVSFVYFILSGFLVLREEEGREERILRTVKHSAVTFGILSVTYFVCNLIVHISEGTQFFSVFPTPRFWFNYLILNVWQFEIGSPIWYVQALLYAYIILYFLKGTSKYSACGER